MMNVEQITSRLAQMPDQALQKYAMMHKEDPYIMALAISESRRRKQLRAAQQMNPMAAQQPKVADQALMEMGVGVDALPTEDMDFAGGGIVAFADGGDVERYNGSLGSLTGGVSPALLAQYNKESEEMGYGQRMQFSPEVKAVADQIRNAKDGAQSDYIKREQQRMLEGSKAIVPTGFTPASNAGIAAAAPISRPTEQMTPQQMETMMSARSAASSAANTEGGLGGTPEAAAARSSAAPSIKGAKELAGQFLDTKSMRDELEKFQREELDAIEKARKLREEGKPQGKAYSKYEEMLQGEEAAAGKERDEATGVAILKAGLAMMSGTSPRAFENIGKGAMSGLEEYSSAMKDLKKAAKERQKAFADIEQARRAEERDDWKAKQEFEDKAQTRLSAARKFGVQGIMDITGKDAEIASRIYDRQVSEYGADRRKNRDLKGELADALMKGDKKRIDALQQAIAASEGGAAGAGMENAATRKRRQQMLELQAIMKDEGMVYSEEDKKWASKRYADLVRENAKESSTNTAQSGDVDKNNPLLK